jgi:hypothetical protein
VELTFTKQIRGVNYGQFDVYEFLKKHPDKWFTSRQVAAHFPEVTYGTITTNLCHLRKSGLLEYQTITSKTGHKMLK